MAMRCSVIVDKPVMELASVVLKEIIEAIIALRKSGMPLLLSMQFAGNALTVSDQSLKKKRNRPA
jgi:ABC-type branched-subunit amino acid transport system ATPase component